MVSTEIRRRAIPNIVTVIPTTGNDSHASVGKFPDQPIVEHQLLVEQQISLGLRALTHQVGQVLQATSPFLLHIAVSVLQHV